MGHNEALITHLEETADRLRDNCLTQFCHIGQGHAGGTMSAVDIVTALYFHHARFDPNNPDWPERDRVVMSKAHACEAVYAALVELGVYPKETLASYYSYGSPFQGHADRWCTKGIDYSGGSLGQGLSFAAGMAYAEKLDTILDPSSREKHPSRYIIHYSPLYRCYCILGDGECNEGQVWEAAMCASKYQLDNLIAIIDYNKFSMDGPTKDVMPMEPLALKWEAFGWWVKEIDGHDMREIVSTLDLAKRLVGDGKPKCIIAHTVKGWGIPSWEDIHVHLTRGGVTAKGVEEGRAQYGQV
jgi:transketolase